MREKQYGSFDEGSDIYRELTPAGVGLSTLLGLFLEIMIFLVFGIHVGQVPVVVQVFLWFLSGLIVSGILVAAAALSDRIRRERTTALNGEGPGYVCGSVPDRDFFVEEIPLAG